ncbi:MAG TPA: hypothetical protein VGI81_15120 [Tepidisphaeraceae bacterium]
MKSPPSSATGAAQSEADLARLDELAAAREDAQRADTPPVLAAAARPRSRRSPPRPPSPSPPRPRAKAEFAAAREDHYPTAKKRPARRDAPGGESGVTGRTS